MTMLHCTECNAFGPGPVVHAEHCTQQGRVDEYERTTRGKYKVEISRKDRSWPFTYLVAVEDTAAPEWHSEQHEVVFAMTRRGARRRATKVIRKKEKPKPKRYIVEEYTQ